MGRRDAGGRGLAGFSRSEREVYGTTWEDVEVSKKIIKTHHAPAAVGPYSQAVVLDGWIWTCGQVALNPETGALVGTDAATQADRVIRNIQAILRAADSGLERVV